MWGGPKSWGAIFFFMVRYGVLISNIPLAVFSFVTLSPEGCSRHNLIHQILLIFTQSIVSIIMIQRMWALYGRDNRVLWSLSAVGACNVGLIIWLLQNQDAHPISVLPGCNVDLSRETSLHLAGAWSALFLFDTIIFALTICSAYSTRRQLGAQAQADMPLHTLIIRDGAIYFAAIGLANLANIITFIIDGPLLPGSLTMFTTCISVAMVSRVMMNIYKKTDVDASEFNLSILREGASIDVPDSDSPEAEAVPHPDPCQSV
ncbi:hypothetical protein B0H13DRAFT_1995710 [Mycena leptocephala]|nr:hypothetical protein B0H13DRAFT_1995710 [Mycena leptocephala]